MFEQLNLLQANTVEETPAQALARQAREAERRADRQAAQDEAARAVALEEAAEARAFTFRQLNVQPGQVLAEAMRAQAEDQEYDDCAARMRKIDSRRQARRQAAEYQAEQLATASRARTGEPEWIDRANNVAAAARVEAMLAARSARPKARRPFGGVAVRSEVTCKDCRNVGASPEESFMIHSDPSPPPIPDDWQAPTEYCRTCYGELPGECKCGKAAGRHDRQKWEDERSLRVAHGGGYGLAVRDGGPIVGVR